MMSRIPTDAIRACVEHTGWTEQEVRNVLGNVIAETPDALLEALPEVIAWAKRIEDSAALVSIMKELPRGVLEITWNGTEPAIRIRPSCDVRQVPEGWEIVLPDEKRHAST
ncbi:MULTISPECIES: hypothetical protein [unclassified Paracoccus (in: a-proteobacteria)]|uniref:hypothetical protein n=1 Tax=unclassified Paracoccus (in: a-proteobacteria) TaxID=2688777 RepID=UPI0012B2DD04|nr:MULTISPECIES: hypothetical protein [unclassified Paracoccus (in: a-proteobacteria)]UXU75527.1 hypothetical protein GB879_003270 [Paracoccus sp. SMMA_5]UXU81432.1 hypothetical protein GB880_003265 [Paracoccus sp. SMMA_5_TC]